MEPSHCDLDTSVPDWLIDHPETETVFREFGIDQSCAGKSLRYACQQRGVNPATVLAALYEAVENHRRQP